MVLFLMFIYSFFLMLFLPIFLPTLKIIYFAPFLIFTFYRNSKKNCLWLALICGFILDLFTIKMHFGIYALNYTLTVYLLFNLKNFFFEDSLTTLPIMLLIFTYTSVFVQLILLNILTSESLISWGWFTTELIISPIYNLLYGVIAFALLFFFLPNKLKKTPVLVKFKEKL